MNIALADCSRPHKNGKPHGSDISVKKSQDRGKELIKMDFLRPRHLPTILLLAVRSVWSLGSQIFNKRTDIHIPCTLAKS